MKNLEENKINIYELMKNIELIENVSQVILLENDIVQISTNHTLKNNFELLTVYLYLKDKQWYLSNLGNSIEDFYIVKN